MYQRTDALVLKSFDFKETDQILTIFSRELGKIPVVAKGVKKPQSTLRGLVQPFCYSQFFITRSGEMYLITQGRINEFFGNIREDLDKTLQAIYILELLDKSTVERDPNPPLLDLALQVLRYMEGNPKSSIYLRFFEIKQLGLVGFAPVLDGCCNCRRTDRLYYFSPSSGGALCSDCAPRIGGKRVMPATLAALRTLQQSGLRIIPRLRLSPAVLEQMEKVMEDYLEFYLEKKLNLKEVMRTIKKS
ncbi:MAG: DNA repair protein RecO [Syntrophomonadaceae bacterium]|nr:DNA repair protein RecO [Syntrophomonadaceae bacterium]